MAKISTLDIMWYISISNELKKPHSTEIISKAYEVNKSTVFNRIKKAIKDGWIMKHERPSYKSPQTFIVTKTGIDILEEDYRNYIKKVYLFM